jgi:hypothetical protein
VPAFSEKSSREQKKGGLFSGLGSPEIDNFFDIEIVRAVPPTVEVIDIVAFRFWTGSVYPHSRGQWCGLTQDEGLAPAK